MAEISFYVKQLGRVVHGRDGGSNKQTASKSCALSMVRQLFHLGVIEAFSGKNTICVVEPFYFGFLLGTLKKQKNAAEMPSFPVKLSPGLREQVQNVLADLGIAPVKLELQPGQSASLLSSHVLDDFNPAPSSQVQINFIYIVGLPNLLLLI